MISSLGRKICGISGLRTTTPTNNVAISIHKSSSVLHNNTWKNEGKEMGLNGDTNGLYSPSIPITRFSITSPPPRSGVLRANYLMCSPLWVYVIVMQILHADMCTWCMYEAGVSRSTPHTRTVVTEANTHVFLEGS